jgi:hypothetical protein
MLAEVSRRGLLHRAARPEDMLMPVAEALRSAAARAFPELAPYTAVVPDEGEQLLVRLHPADEEVRVGLHGERILLSARTNGGGPGYHAFVVALMDEVAAAHKLRWLPEVTEGDTVFNDETGYFADRRVDVLKDSMAAWLVAVARHLSEAAVDGNLYLMSMPMGTPVPCGLAGVVTPMGCVSLSWLRETADPEATEADARARAAGFFPWWEPAVDEHARVGVGRSALWRFPWHPPQGDEEAALANVALACLGPSPSSLGPGGAISHRDIEELATITVTPAADARPPSSDGFGFMRRTVRRMPFPGCTLELPGYFYEQDDETDRAKVYWFGDRVVRVDSWLVTSSEPGGPTPRELVERSTTSELGRPAPAGAFAIEAPPVTGYCVLLEPDDGETSRNAHAVIERPGRMLLLTITFPDAADAGWVESVVRSVNLQPSEGQ